MEVPLSSMEGMTFGVFELEHVRDKDGSNEHAKDIVGHNEV